MAKMPGGRPIRVLAFEPMKGQSSADVADGPPATAGFAPRQAARAGARGLRVGFWSAGLAALAFLFGFGLFSSHVGRLFPPDSPRAADAIIVLTGGQARIDTAVELLKSGKAKRLLISGVNPAAPPEDIKRISGADDALFGCCIDIDRLAADTVGNAQESVKWMNANAYGSAILVTNNYHMPRSLLEMRRFGAGADITPYPVVNTRIDRGEWLLNADALRVLFTEYTKFLAASARDLIAGGASASPGVATASAD